MRTRGLEIIWKDIQVLNESLENNVEWMIQ